MEMNPYIFFDGQCEAAFKFYEKTLGGKIEMMTAHEGSPAAAQVSAEWQKKWMVNCEKWRRRPLKISRIR